MRPLLFGAAMASVLGLTIGAMADDEKESKLALDKVPKTVLDAVKAKFPEAKFIAAEQGKDDGENIFEIELKQNDRSIDVVLSEDGTIDEVEKEIAVEDLPQAVSDALTVKYPGAKIEEAEEVTEFEDDEESDEKEDAQASDDASEDKAGENEVSYEVELVTADGKTLEVEVSADGKHLEAESDDDGETDDE